VSPKRKKRQTRVARKGMSLSQFWTAIRQAGRDWPYPSVPAAELPVLTSSDILCLRSCWLREMVISNRGSVEHVHYRTAVRLERMGFVTITVHPWARVARITKHGLFVLNTIAAVRAVVPR
jgi:hypothetical protein